jgi:hypothetical protein
VRIENLLRIGNLLQDYYTNIREARNLGQNWWTGDYQDEANFASYLAQHDIGILYWPEYETKYHSLTGSYSYLDAKEKLDKVIFLGYTAGVDCYNDSDYEKIRKILQFFKFNIHYEPDLNQIIRAPVETLGLKSGDCDDWATLAAAAFARAGINSAVMMVKSKDGTQAHAMVLVQSKEDLPLWYYSDLTQFGLPSGRWWIIEPQYTLEEQSLHPEWFSQWDIVAAAWVLGYRDCRISKEEESSTHTPNIYKGTEDNNSEALPCFLSGTKVLMADGTYKNIENIKPGEKVVSFDLVNKKITFSKVEKLFRKIDSSYLIINNRLKLVPHQLIYVNGKWEEAKNVKIGDNLLNNEGKQEKVVSVSNIVNESVLTYDLELESVGNFFAENYLVKSVK